ncbi:xanthine dehydrogenase accessory protein XdhC [Litorisediminicola beolgyonensis]|uniref:Xanthine dehydrogenase accessory protein XdhC n=1 Tax=Litorisediminicola beolgyonensis TaxID=1173614 RepID=A0ABW3ZCM1_9RHOB
MSFDLAALAAAVERHGTVARVVVAATRGSVPRETGAAMLVWPGGQSGTIGGGRLEYEAAARALSHQGLTHHPLGPALGQCCGGHVTLLTEHWTAGRLAELAGTDIVARGPEPRPLSVARRLDAARARGDRPEPQLLDGWMVEPVTRATVPVWIWGAGHVGRALIDVLAPIPDLDLTWIDTAPERFPDPLPYRVSALPAAVPERVMPRAPQSAHHLILTYSHATDLALCHAALTHGFASAGLIGSDTKWARFRKRLGDLGHSAAEIDRIRCPIGQKSLGKHPQAIAVGTAARLLETVTTGARNPWPTHCSASGA